MSLSAFLLSVIASVIAGILMAANWGRIINWMKRSSVRFIKRQALMIYLNSFRYSNARSSHINRIYLVIFMAVAAMSVTEKLRQDALRVVRQSSEILESLDSALTSTIDDEDRSVPGNSSDKSTLELRSDLQNGRDKLSTLATALYITTVVVVSATLFQYVLIARESAMSAIRDWQDRLVTRLLVVSTQSESRLLVHAESVVSGAASLRRFEVVLSELCVKYGIAAPSLVFYLRRTAASTKGLRHQEVK